MEHLLYVLWHDHWKPWLVEWMKDIGWILFGIGAIAAFIMSAIALEMWLETLTRG